MNPCWLILLITIVQLVRGAQIFDEPKPLWLIENEPDPSGDNQRLAELVGRIGPNMRASADYHDYKDIQLNDSLLAWKLLHQQTQLFAQNQVHFHGPKLERLVREANVSQGCEESIKLTLASMERLESWAVQMWSSTGSFPSVGLFDGQFSDIGSYRGCVDLHSKVNMMAHNTSVGYTSYCTVAFRPIVPTRPRFHMVFHKVPEQLLNLFNESDIFNSLAHQAQYFNYIYVKTGICVPHQCSAQDIQQVIAIVSRRLLLMAGPVKCFTRAPSSQRLIDGEIQARKNEYEFGKIENEPVQVYIERPMSRIQFIAALIVSSFFGLVLLASTWHAVDIVCFQKTKTGETNGIDHECGDEGDAANDGKYKQEEQLKDLMHQSTSGIKHVSFHYFSMITNGREFMDTTMKSNEIKCLHGLRVLTMVWIICVHSFQYNEWSGFTRVFENLPTLQDPVLHPIYNANYVVDNFFFMSGLLAAYTIWFANKGTSNNFSAFTSLIGRYLRLTPQVLLISLLYILLPLVGDGPFWYDMSHYAAKYCEKNWWVNLLHLQSFYREDEICNLVGWWISIDMFYYVLALLLIIMILNNQMKRAIVSTLAIVTTCMSISVYRHFTGQYTPNNLGTVAQVAEVWTRYVVNFFWSPYPHAYPFYLGLWIGYVLANNKWQRQVRQWSRVGWYLAMVSLATVNMSSHIWMSGSVELGSQYISTAYNNICTIVWATAFAWLVVACQYGCAPTLNRILSIQLFVLLSKASFIVYLSHMLIVRMYFGLQYSLLEVSKFTFSYAIVGNVFASSLFGVFLCIAFEGPCMKFQKLVIQTIKNHNRKQSAVPTSTKADTNHSREQKVVISMGATGNALLK